ncbi:MAG TPA: hypothetical protein VG125_24645, partial [Pirellulales bacterium]|nr:hypothetical protein [Pirellulales bacterium]
MFSFRAWLRRFACWVRAVKRPVRVRRGRHGGAWFSRGREPRTIRQPYRDSALHPFERLEPLTLLSGDNWIGGASGSWTDAANWSAGVPTATSDVSITGNVTVSLPAGSYSIASLQLAAAATIGFTLDGTRAGTDYAVLDVAGTAALDGTTNIALAAGYTPGANDTYQPLLYGSESGSPTVTVASWASHLLEPKSLYIVPVSTGTLTVTNTADSGAGSLRDAITTANGSTNPVEFIKFNIPSSDPGYNATAGVWTISPATALPAVSAHAIIDATTQPGYAGQPVVQLTPKTSTSLGASYVGLNLSNSGFWVPPDTQGAAGPKSYVEAVNQEVAVYDKGTGATVKMDSLPDFFFTQGGLAHVTGGTGDFQGDSFTTYDPLAGRFIVGDLEVELNNGFFNGAQNALLLAVSKSNNPTTLTSSDWYFYEIPTSEAGVALQDYPGNVGYNADALVITQNSFSESAYLHVLVNTISINALVNGQTLTEGTNLFQTNLSGSTSYSVRPTAMQDAKPGDPMWFVEESGNNQSIDVVKMTNVLSSTPTFATTSLTVNAYSPAVAEKQPNGTTITTNTDSRIMDASMAKGLIVAAHSVSDAAGDLDKVQWYEIATTGGTPTLQQQGNVSGGAGTYYAYPSIAINSQGDIGMTYIASGTAAGQYMSTYVTGRAPNDQAATMHAPLLVQAGSANNNDGREGDMSGINVDGDGTFWATNEYAASNGSWNTAIAHFTIGAGATFSADGLDITGGHSRVSGLAINGFNGDAVHLSGTGFDTLTADDLGTNPTGSQAIPNTANGVEMTGVSNNVIGGLVNDLANVISGNGASGILIDAASGANGVVGNLIGTDASGTVALANGTGVSVLGANNTIGGTTARARNVISGNIGAGVVLSGASATGNVVEGNYVGTNGAGGVPPAAPAWQPIGPAPIVGGQTAGSLTVSGRVTGIATDPADANTVYLAAAGGGVWKTTNATSASPTWTPLTDNLTDGSGNPLPEFMGAVAETDATSGAFNGHQIAYAGTGEANNNIDGFYGEGILVSTDGGSTWTLQTAGGAFNGETVAKIVIDPADTSGATAFAAVDGFAVNGTNGHTGIWKTTDFGATWTNVTGGVGLSAVDEWSDVVIDPHTPSTLYAADGTLVGATGNGLYKSTDSGATWSLLTNGPTGADLNVGRITLALYDDGTTDELFVSVANGNTNSASFGTLYEMLESTNGGSTFSSLTSNITNYLGGQGWYDTTLAVDPKNANYIYAAGQMTNQGPTFSGSPLESFDGGKTWHDIATDPANNGPHSDAHAVAFDANGNLLDGNDGGVFELTNPTSAANERWSSLNTNLQITQFTGIAVDPTNPNVVYGGSQDNGTEKYTGTTSWNLADFGDGGMVRVDPANNSVVYHTYAGFSLVVSTDAGATWNDITTGIVITNPNNANFYAPFTLDSSGDIYYGSDYLNFSSDQGTTWTQIGTHGINGFNAGDSSIDAIAVSPTDNNVVYVSAGGHVFVTTNAQAGGNSVKWTQIDLPNGRSTNGLGDFGQDAIAVDPSDATGGTAYAVVPAFTGGGNHVFKTINFGITWTDISASLLDTPCNAVAVSSDGKTIFVGTDVGVYSTTDGGTTWTVVGTGLPNAKVTDLELAPGQNLLVAGTHGRGAFVISTPSAQGFIPRRQELGDPGDTQNDSPSPPLSASSSPSGAVPNGADGIQIVGGANNNTVGGTTAGAGNVISGNTGDGIDIINPGTANNLVEGNYVGTDATGTNPLANAFGGVNIYGSAANNTIGGTAAGAGNVISANTLNGVSIRDPGSAGNLVEGNFIGTDKTGETIVGTDGTSSLGNGVAGIEIGNGATSNTIGGTTSGAGNVISGNAIDGIDLNDVGTSGNLVEGNLIGTDAHGTIALGNHGNGAVVIFAGATSNTIGGITAAARNVIAADSGNGVFISDSGTSQNLVEGNYIGTDSSGAKPLGNAADGVIILAGASHNTIGAGNVISGNAANGVEIQSNGNWAEGNLIGTDLTGTIALPNGEYGVLLINRATGNTIGTNADGVNDSAERNVISGNSWSGLAIIGIGTDGNSVAGNLIGTDATGEKGLANSNNGVAIFGGAQQNVIGTSGTSKDDVGQRNVISANTWSGVAISDDGTDQNTIAGNYIGTDAAGTAALGNANNGVSIFGGAQGNVIGANGDGHDDAAKRNVLSANTWHGVYIDASSDQNTVAGNLIGLDETGAAKLGNQLSGIQVLSVGNTIGGPLAVEANTIAANAGAGIELFGDSSEYLSTPAGGQLALGLGNGAAISQPVPVPSTAPITAGAGQALSFDGANTQAQTGATNVMNGASLTLEAWVNPALRYDDNDQGFYPDNVISNDLPSDYGRGFGVNVWAPDSSYPSGGSQLTIEYEDGFRIVPGVTFTAGTWYHVAVVYKP